jgi:histidyl-tRNA synthetase
MFRYERPQKGRYRQHHQVGAEIMGTTSVEADLEILSLAKAFLAELGLADHITLELNSMGDMPSRLQFREALVGYLRGHAANLSADSQLRLERNPLRILDSKRSRRSRRAGQRPPADRVFRARGRRVLGGSAGGVGQPEHRLAP